MENLVELTPMELPTASHPDKEVKTHVDYPSEYTESRPIDEQIMRLVEIFDLDPTHALRFITKLPALPDGAEGWFAIPSVSALAKRFFPEVTDPAEQYCCAVQFAYEKLAASRTCCNNLNNTITPKHLRVHARTAYALGLIADEQPGDILVIAAQFGKLHRGQMPSRARELFKINEFGLGFLAVCSMALTHPERFVYWEQLWAVCVGDEYDVHGEDCFGRGVTNMFFSDSMVHLLACSTRGYGEKLASVTAFV